MWLSYTNSPTVSMTTEGKHSQYQKHPVQDDVLCFIPLVHLWFGVSKSPTAHDPGWTQHSSTLRRQWSVCHWPLSLSVAPALYAHRAKSTRSSELCRTSLCVDTSISCVCIYKMALSRAELSVRWSKHSLLTLGSLTQEMCDLSCWVA